MAARLAIDGDHTTRWGGAFSAGHWLQIDLGRPAAVGGALLHWDSGFAATYTIQSSIDGEQWQNAYEAMDSQGASEYVFFPTVQARYLRLASVPRTADWGVSVFEFEPLGANESPRITGLAKEADASVVWSIGPARPVVVAGRTRGTRELRIELPRPLPIAGLEVFWGGPRRSARLEGRELNGRWMAIADDPDPLGDNSYLASRDARTLNELRLIIQSSGNQPPAISRLRLLSPARTMTSMKRYEIEASRAYASLYPTSLHRQQVYWTVIGLPAGRQKSVFDEYGNLEAFKGAPLVQPIWRDANGNAVAAGTASDLAHSLRDRWMPMPAVEWSPQPGLQLRSEAFTIEQAGAPVTVLRHRLKNTGTQRVDGQLSLLVRPMQINPPWQSGGISPIRTVSIEGDPATTSVRINGRTLLHSLTPVHASGASGFGNHGEEEITHFSGAGKVPSSQTARDEDALAAAMLNYSVQLEPGATRDIIVAFPLGNDRIDPTANALPDAPAIDRDQLGDFDALSAQVANEWQQRLGKIDLSLPDASLVDMFKAQAAYMLINQTGPAMQPGPRNYNRSFIRDGSATAAALLRVGMAKTARDYLRWYSDHAVHENGLVSPILNDDGTVNTGFGSDIEYDSQGEFVWLVAEIARLDGGADSVREYQPKVKLALQFLKVLRDRTLVPGYMADREAPERFRGIIAPSISHEGYATPTHSYWDDYWALKGWHDGAWLAEAWGDKELASWAKSQYAALRESVSASIIATMQWRGVDYIPAAADLGDGDPTSVSIGLDPCGQQDLLPADALQRTFTKYLEDVRKRDVPDALYAYTPYEMRNVLTYVHLDHPGAANELLTNLMHHRRPLEWQVFAEVVHSRLRHPGYLGDMPHTWIGSEYMRAVLGMLMHAGDSSLQLLPGTPSTWVADDGLSVKGLPTAYGTLSMSARQAGTTLEVKVEPGVRAGTPMEVSWPSRQKPKKVIVDGKSRKGFTADGIRLERPFRRLVAEF